MLDDQTARHTVASDLRLVGALCGKYEKLCELREREQTAVAPRAEMVALSRAFPGALRELDCLPWDELQRRVSALRAVIEGRAVVEHWMVLQVSYHGFMRAALRLRRMMLEHAGDGDLAPLAYQAAADEPPRERFDAQALSEIRKPPQGRLNAWVIAQVAKDYGVAGTCIESALWGVQSAARP